MSLRPNQEWEQNGSRHFVSQRAFESHRRHYGIVWRKETRWRYGWRRLMLVGFGAAIMLIERILELVVALGAFCWMCAMVVPSVMDGVETALRSVARTLWKVIWHTPVRRIGIARTLLVAWLIGAVIVSVVAWKNARNSPLSRDFKIGLVVIWCGVSVFWMLLRVWAWWLYRPQPLPRRRRR